MISHKPKKYNKKRFVPLAIVKAMALEAGVDTRAHYWKWCDKHQLKYIPKYPNRTYPTWISWNDFLENTNSFGELVERHRKITRPYWEAVRWVQAQGYEDQHDYKRHYADGDVPDDIPKAPNAFYPEWQGWGVWLGSNIRSFVMSKSEDLNMIALCRITNQAGNLIEVITNPDGVKALQQQVAARTDLTPFKVYHVADDERIAVTEVLNKFGSDQGGNVYIVQNTFELISELEIVAREYVPGT